MTPNTTGFIGFPDVKMKPVIIPDLFFSDLLPQIDDLAELKLTLHCLWLLNEQSGDLRYIRGDDLRGDAVLLTGLNLEKDLRPPAVAEARWSVASPATLLRLEIITGPERARADAEAETAEDWYFSTPSRTPGANWCARARSRTTSVIPDND